MLNILIADDETINTLLMKEALSKYGNCEVVSNGIEAVDIFTDYVQQEKYFDIICLDIMMPKLDGHDALKEIRAIEKQNGLTDSKAAKVVMTTALGDPENIMLAMVQGECDGYLTKPIDLNELYELLCELDLQLKV